MITASKLAGFLAAHAIWCVSEGATLIPILAYTTEDDQRKMERLVIGDDLDAPVPHGKERLESKEMAAMEHVLLNDGRSLIGREKVDASIIEMRAYFSADSEAVMAVPYTPKDAGAFRVHKPKLLGWKKCDDFDMHAALDS